MKRLAGQFEVWSLAERKAARLAPPPLVLLLQSPRLNDLATTIVAPIGQVDTLSGLGRVRPTVEFDGHKLIVAFDRLAVIERVFLSEFVFDASEHEWAFKAALDELLF